MFCVIILIKRCWPPVSSIVVCITYTHEYSLILLKFKYSAILLEVIEEASLDAEKPKEEPADAADKEQDVESEDSDDVLYEW